MNRSGRFGWMFLGVTLAALTMGTQARAQAGKVVFLVRHAEKSAEPSGDPTLTTAGFARATALAEALKDADIDHVITTQLRRTVETAGEVVSQGDLEPEIVAVRGGIPAHIKAVGDAVRARPDGEAILVVGHSNTIPAIVGELGGSRLPDLADNEYSTIFVVTLVPGHEPRTARLKFGSADPTQ